jgi:hypothetical protein
VKILSPVGNIGGRIFPEAAKTSSARPTRQRCAPAVDPLDTPHRFKKFILDQARY